MASSNPLLQKLGAEPQRLREIVLAELDRLPKATGTQTGLSRSLNDVLAQAQKEADRLKDEYVSTEHMLLALAQIKSEAREILTVGGVKHDTILSALKEIRGGSASPIRIPRTNIRPCSGTAAIWSKWPGRERSIR